MGLFGFDVVNQQVARWLDGQVDSGNVELNMVRQVVVWLDGQVGMGMYS